MKRNYKALLSLLLAFLMVLIPNVSVLASSNESSNDDFQILYGEYDNELIVIENGEKSFIRYGYDNGKFKVYLYDSNNVLMEVYEDPSSEIDMENNNFFNNVGESIYRAGGDGSRSNPYMYCTPGSARTTSSRISYSQIIGMVGMLPSLASATAALIALIKSGTGAVVTAFALKELADFVVNVIKSSSVTWLNQHGINVRIRLVCSLQNHKDGAWNEDIWFYGELASLTSYSRY